MQKPQREFLLEQLNILKANHEDICNFLISGEIEDVIKTLVSCQEKAIALGEVIEKFEGEDCPCIKKLEGYCELLYDIHVSFSGGKTPNPDEIKEKLAGLPEEAEKAIAQIKEKLASAEGTESAAEAVLVVDHETKLLLGASFGVRESSDGAVTPVLAVDRRTEDGSDIARLSVIGSGEGGKYGCAEIKKTTDETRTEGGVYRWGLYINGSEAVSFTSSEGGKKIVFESAASIPGLGGLASALGGQSGKLTFTLESFDTGFDEDQKDLQCRDIFSDDPDSGYGLSQIMLALSAFGIGNASDADPSSIATLIPFTIR